MCNIWYDSKRITIADVEQFVGVAGLETSIVIADYPASNFVRLGPHDLRIVTDGSQRSRPINTF